MERGGGGRRGADGDLARCAVDRCRRAACRSQGADHGARLAARCDARRGPGGLRHREADCARFRRLRSERLPGHALCAVRCAARALREAGAASARGRRRSANGEKGRRAARRFHCDRHRGRDARRNDQWVPAYDFGLRGTLSAERPIAELPEETFVVPTMADSCAGGCQARLLLQVRVGSGEPFTENSPIFALDLR
jgi:hypothetical protein